MANADQNAQSPATATDPEQLNEWLNSMETLMASFDNGYIQSCSIFIVPQVLKESYCQKKKVLKESNDDAAYMPRVVSMGPRYKGSREDLLLMEEIKLRCMLSLVHRAGIDGQAREYFKECSEAIWNLDRKIRASYVADIKLEKHELAKIMLVDGCFLLELLISKSNELNTKLPSRLVDPPGPAPQVLKNEDVLSDLVLLENQIPIFVLHELFQTLFPNFFTRDREKRENPEEDEEQRLQRVTRINNLAFSLLGYSLPQVQSLEAPHILDLVHSFVNRKEESSPTTYQDGNAMPVTIMDTQRVKLLKLNRCASRLQAAGVSIIKLPQDTDSSSASSCGFLRNCFGGTLMWLGSLIMTAKPEDMAAQVDVRGLDFDFKFKNGGKLEIAQLHITKTTRAKWRNVIAWEHHKYWKSSSISAATDEKQSMSGSSPNGKFTSSALIFNGLICCEADVKLVKDKNIIVDHEKMSNEDLVAFFRAMSFGIDRAVVGSSYAKMVRDLNNYSESFFLVRILKTGWHLFTYRLVGLVKFMTRNYNFVATVLAALNVVQAVYAILAYYFRD